MLYEIADGTHRKTLPEQMKPGALYIGLIGQQKLNEFVRRMGSSRDAEKLCRTTDPARRNTLTAYPEFSLGLLDVVQPTNILGGRDKIAFLVFQNLFLVVDLKDDDSSTVAAVEKALARAASMVRPTLEKVACELLTALTRNDEILLDRLEQRLAVLDERVLVEKRKNCNPAISEIRHELLVLHSYYRHLWQIGEELCANENELFEEKNIQSLRLFVDRCKVLVENVQTLQEFAQQVRETYQAELDLRQNNIMRIFTVVATVFLPLTLLTGWYGMNFVNMPELTYPWAYRAVTVISLLIVAGCLYWFRKKDLL